MTDLDQFTICALLFFVALRWTRDAIDGDPTLWDILFSGVAIIGVIRLIYVVAVLP